MKIEDLELRVSYLNKLTKNRIERYLPYKIDSKLISNKGHYYISQYNSSYGVEQIVNTMGGCTDVSYRGSKKEIYNWLNAYIKGIEAVLYK
tara:strand:- start:334 stop:606 length:273 start_codon:yes stop_codon:yes gene_type:complete